MDMNKFQDGEIVRIESTGELVTVSHWWQYGNMGAANKNYQYDIVEKPGTWYVEYELKALEGNEMTVNNLEAEVTEILSEVPVDAGTLRKALPESEEAVLTLRGGKTLTDKEKEEQSNDAWYVKHRGIAYNFGAAGINVIGEDAE